jgi:hypothetical protein
VKPAPDTHDFTLARRRWGHDIGVDTVERGGKKIKVHGWGGGLKPGDYVLLSASPEATTRYQVAKIEYMRDPSDMFFAALKFAPRRTKEEK